MKHPRTSGTKRCPSCRALCLVAETERGRELLIDKDPRPDGHVVFEQAHVEGQALGARRARFLEDGEPVKPGSTRWTWHGWSCPKARRKTARREEPRELWSPVKEA